MTLNDVADWIREHPDSVVIAAPDSIGLAVERVTVSESPRLVIIQTKPLLCDLSERGVHPVSVSLMEHEDR